MSAVATPRRTEPPDLSGASPPSSSGGPPPASDPRPEGWAAAGERPAAAAVRLAAFAALGAFAAAHWFALLERPPLARLVGVVVVSVATGAALVALGRAELSRPRVRVAALVTALTGGALAMVVAGLPARLLSPGAWDELSVQVDRGLAGIRTVDWPYGGPEEWVRLVILLGAPLLLSLGAALSFWPARRGRSVLRALGLVALLALYGIAVTEHDQGAPIVRGFVLLLLVGALLWLPRVRGREAAVGAAVVVCVGIGAAPVASRLDGEIALVDYHAWNWYGGEDITFNWNHSYGPLDWPREGTTLLNVESERPMYWKAETLDSFDGLRWRRSEVSERTEPGAELPPDPDERWDARIRVTVRSLRTDFVVATGTPYLVDGIGEAVSGSADGTVRRLDEPLHRGDSYTVRSYAPNPSPRRMRADSGVYPGELEQYTRVTLPAEGETALPDRPVPGDALRREVSVPLRGSAAFSDPAVGRTLARSPYARTYGLTRRLTLAAPTVYDAVDRVQDHLRSSYTYSESPPTRAYPLEAFLFEDEIGYCQQFSGAMALMLRMAGIPARVVSGFSPGSLDRETGEYRVRDLDAHSWVEVYFADIGWVTFDPTPRAAPADRAGQGPEAERLDVPAGGEASSGGGEPFSSDRPGDSAATAAGQEEEDGGSGAEALLMVGLVGAATVAAVLAVRRRRARAEGDVDAAEASLRELERALVRLGWPLAPGMTLLELERDLRHAAGPGAARYVGRLRAGRFAPGGAPPPRVADRRVLRRELTAARGWRARLRGFAALPPRRPHA